MIEQISNIVFVAYTPLTTKFSHDFYMEEFEQAGYKVEYWNLTSLFHGALKFNGEINNEKVLNIDNYKKLEERIKQIKAYSLFIFNITYSARVYKLFKLFTKHKCLTGIFARGALPSPSINHSLAKKFVSKFKAITDLKYVGATISNQLSILAKRLKLIKSYDFIFYAGKSGIATIGYGFKYGLEDSKLIPINSFDYDNYLLMKQDNRQIQEPYCVFLDGYLPYHPDFIMMRLPQLDANKYYTALNNFFSWVENTYSVKVVIAAHPKSDYNNKNSYAGRKIIKNKTAELVQYSEFVLLHASTAISFAVLFKKRLIFINTKAIKELYYYTHYLLIIYFSELLKATYVNVDEEFNNAKILPVDEHAYKTYKYNYLTNIESEQQLSVDIVISTLKTSNKNYKH